AADVSGVTLAADPDLLAVVDPGGNRHVEPPLGDLPAAAVALGARRGDEVAQAAALRARRRPHELAEHAARHLLHAAAAGARRARDRRRAGLGAVAVAPVARDADPEWDVALDPARRIREVDLYLGGDVGSARPPRPPPHPEEVVAEEGGEDVREVPEVERPGREAAALEAGVAVPVVEFARLRVREHLVRLGDLAEPLLRVGRLGDVRVQLAREPPERALDVLLGRA